MNFLSLTMWFFLHFSVVIPIIPCHLLDATSTCACASVLREYTRTEQRTLVIYVAPSILCLS